MNVDLKQILGALVIASITWVASSFLNANSELAILKQQISTMSTVIQEIRNDLRDARTTYALRTEMDKLEARVQKLEERKP